MSADPTITVVVPAYNHEAYVGEALASLQAQTMPGFDVVVIDDGSIDRTADIAESFARDDPRFTVVRQANAGSHGAINRGVAEARGDWIAILNSDDRYAPGRLARLRDEARAGAHFVVTATRLIDGDGAQIADPGHWWWKTVAHFHRKAVELGPVDGLLYGNYTVSTSNFFFSRALFDAVGPMRPLRFVIDWDWALRAALHAPAAMRYLADEPLLDYRLHGSNTILRGALRGACEVNRMHRELLARYGAPPALVAALFRNQRLLRNNWRAAGEASAEKYVREREADVASLREQAVVLERFVRAREADVLALRARLDEATATRRRLERLLPWRAWRALGRLIARRKS
ncbi:MAG: glycosyltransferase [Burkholderiaceae bacterium]|nr:glycosyltransferase [Burkholderiaceae bacterium]